MGVINFVYAEFQLKSDGWPQKYIVFHFNLNYHRNCRCHLKGRTVTFDTT